MARVEMQKLQLFGASQNAAIAAFSAGKDCRFPELRSSLRHHYRGPEQCERLLLAGWRMAMVEGAATVKQRRILTQCAHWLGCSKAACARYEELAKPQRSHPQRPALNELDAALQLLGVRRTDSLAVIKRAYRRQLSLHHPDKMIGAGTRACANSRRHGNNPSIAQCLRAAAQAAIEQPLDIQFLDVAGHRMNFIICHVLSDR